MTNVRETVRDAFEAVKGTVQHTAKSVKETVAAAKQVDVEGIIDRHPWLFIGGFMTLGYVAYRVLEHAGTSAKAPGAAPCPKNGSPHDNGPHDNGPHDNGRHDSGRHEPEPASQEPTPSPPTPAAENWAELMTELKALAIGVPLSVLRDKLATTGAETFRSQVVEIMNGLTARLGGKVIQNRCESLT